MQRKNRNMSTYIVLLCVLFAFVLIFSEAIATEHDCTGEHCVVCALCSFVKFVFAIAVCSFAVVSYGDIIPRVHYESVVHKTPVSCKEKLTI